METTIEMPSFDDEKEKILSNFFLKLKKPIWLKFKFSFFLNLKSLKKGKLQSYTELILKGKDIKQMKSDDLNFQTE